MQQQIAEGEGGGGERWMASEAVSVADGVELHAVGAGGGMGGKRGAGAGFSLNFDDDEEVTEAEAEAEAGVGEEVDPLRGVFLRVAGEGERQVMAGELMGALMRDPELSGRVGPELAERYKEKTGVDLDSMAGAGRTKSAVYGQAMADLLEVNEDDYLSLDSFKRAGSSLRSLRSISEASIAGGGEEEAEGAQTRAPGGKGRSGESGTSALREADATSPDPASQARTSLPAVSLPTTSVASPAHATAGSQAAAATAVPRQAGQGEALTKQMSRKIRSGKKEIEAAQSLTLDHFLCEVGVGSAPPEEEGMSAAGGGGDWGDGGGGAMPVFWHSTLVSFCFSDDDTSEEASSSSASSGTLRILQGDPAAAPVAAPWAPFHRADLVTFEDLASAREVCVGADCPSRACSMVSVQLVSGAAAKYPDLLGDASLCLRATPAIYLSLFSLREKNLVLELLASILIKSERPPARGGQPPSPHKVARLPRHYHTRHNHGHSVVQQMMSHPGHCVLYQSPVWARSSDTGAWKKFRATIVAGKVLLFKSDRDESTLLCALAVDDAFTLTRLSAIDGPPQVAELSLRACDKVEGVRVAPPIALGLGQEYSLELWQEEGDRAQELYNAMCACVAVWPHLSKDFVAGSGVDKPPTRCLSSTAEVPCWEMGLAAMGRELFGAGSRLYPAGASAPETKIFGRLNSYPSEVRARELGLASQASLRKFDPVIKDVSKSEIRKMRMNIHPSKAASGPVLQAVPEHAAGQAAAPKASAKKDAPGCACTVM